ncbi:hypothetical protein OG992_33405 [Micromonospora sp. NBC_00362]|uniref:hypothetical protein n=1 Tax=Micromonospora sp. NBC_00362 TaxID=2975975 RepID=UPI00224F1757|nr:hypothetical protein [Micromonospora sp. NBC_00362]MCX5122063.1 hypothetical protein [Micromonospora sp. NBC_00362]
MTAIDPVFDRVPERYYTHNEHRGGTLHRSAKAAAWVELALLIPRLIGSGHSAEQVEE